MLIHLERMRLDAISALYRGYVVTKIPTMMVKVKLNLSSEADAEELIRACGYYYDNASKRYKRVTDSEEWV